MIRVVSFALFAVALVMLVDSARAEPPAKPSDKLRELPVAPPPREVRPDGTSDPVPEPVKAEDPAVVVDRIIKNSKDVGDKLAATDTGKDTRKTQDKILTDIDSLINRQENPPPKSNSGENKDKSPMNMDPMNNKDPMNKDGMSGNEPMNKDMGNKDMGNKQNGMPMPMDGMNNQQSGMQPMGGNQQSGPQRRPRRGDPMGNDKQAQNQPEPKDQKDPMNKMSGQPKDPNNKQNAGAMPGGNNGGKPKDTSLLPFEEDFAKDTWGHLSDKLRQQMTQYYKEDVMPKYSDLLRLYYSSLSEKSGKSMPRK